MVVTRYSEPYKRIISFVVTLQLTSALNKAWLVFEDSGIMHSVNLIQPLLTWHGIVDRSVCLTLLARRVNQSCFLVVL